MKQWILYVTVACVGGAGCATTAKPAAQAPQATQAITKEQVQQAQLGWCDALVSISAAHARKEDPRPVAERALSSAYAYEHGGTLFKPTLAYGPRTFRLDRKGALSYFIGGDADYPEDKGFALKGWTTCQPEVAGFVTSGDMALAVGNVRMTDAKGQVTTVDKTFGYRRMPDGALRIVLHHSSLPYTP